MKNEILIIPDKPDLERDSIANIWKQKGGEVMRIGKFWVKPETGNKRVSIYGYDSFCLVLAQILEIEMLMPKDEMIADLAFKFLKRKIELYKVGEIEKIYFPKFIKPVTPKLFKADVFKSVEELEAKIEHIEETEILICSDIIEVEKEIRSFILDREIKDLAFYEGKGKIKTPIKFIKEFLEECKFDLPKTFVLDIGYNNKSGWFVIEFNSSWGAGLNFCSAEKVIDCIRAAAIN
ncbi:MAG: ATP-grasp domain-containing protein [Saprospiraceae bacterium]